jgi:beta-lactamase class A
VAVIDTGSGRVTGRRENGRFPLCSTFKALAAACVLARVDRGEESLERRMVYSAAALVPYSPVTGEHAGPPGLAMGKICEAAVTLSDNTAGNLMLDSFGGPAGLTAWVRSMGDVDTRLDRTEPTLNEAAAGDVRDTTTPMAMARLIRHLALGDALSATSRAQLVAWLVACRTGGSRLRAGVPADWRVGDKTGTGGDHSTNDVAVLWPPGRAAVIVTAYYVSSPAPDEERAAVLASVGRLAVAWTLDAAG